MAYALGVVQLAFAPDPVTRAAQRARTLGFDHLDVIGDVDEPLALPIGDRIAFPAPRPGRSTPAPPAGAQSWEDLVQRYRAAPGMRLEPWSGSMCSSTEAVREMLRAVPGLRLLVDVGHVRAWDGDPLELLPYADHVQLRDARPGAAQVAPGDGDVDFAAVVQRLRALEYPGLVSVEYFDLPSLGWPCDDPVGWAVDLAARVRPLL